MIFNPKLWRKEAVTVLASTLASLYATVLCCVYISFAFTELVTYPLFKDYLEINGFFIYIFFVSDVYFIFILYQVLTAKEEYNGKARIIENEKSHGSLTIRMGAIIFGIGTFVYLMLKLIQFFETGSDSPCYHVTKGINVFLMLFFVLLQTFIIFTYPRLNLLGHQLLNRYGTMHVVATNIILWLRTLVKESLEEIAEIEEEHKREQEHMHDAERIHHSRKDDGHGNCTGNSFLDGIMESESLEEICEHFKLNILGGAIAKTTPYLYPFIIEFALIGASVTFIMSNHIGKWPKHPTYVPNRVRRPSPVSFLQKKDFSHSLKGILFGAVILTIALVNLTLFYGLDVHEHTEDVVEYLAKISNTVINLLGIIGLIIGLSEIQELQFRDPENNLILEMDLDVKLLRFTSIFAFIYMIFTIITGAFNSNVADFPDELHIINGVISILQISLQITFIENLKQKVLPPDKVVEKPGRQITIFLFIFNLAQWLVFTFEVQKVRASLVEANFYGFMPWIVIQRVTLPLAVFFRCVNTDITKSNNLTIPTSSNQLMSTTIWNAASTSISIRSR